MLDLARLRTLQRFSVCGTIAATAASLGYSASAVSQQLTTLEREVDAVLFERTARSAVLTDAGRLLVRHAVELLAAVERAESEIAAQVGTMHGHLTVSAIPNLAASVAAALARIQRQHPDLEIAMRETVADPAVAAVADHRSDVAITDDWSPRPRRAPEGLIRRVICTEAVGLAVSTQHPLAAHDGPLGGRDFANAVTEMTWLCSPSGFTSRMEGDRRLDGLKVAPRRRWEFEGLITIAELVAGDAGCALLPQMVAYTQDRAWLRLIPLVPRMSRRVQAITRSSTVTNPSTALCLSAITDELRLTAARQQPAAER